MPIRLTTPIVKDFILVRSDSHFGLSESEATKVSIRQATQIDNERRAELFAKTERIFDSNPGEIRVKSNWTLEQLKRLETYCSLSDCNIEAEDGKPLFKFRSENGVRIIDMTMGEFEKAWGKLPALVAGEIYEKVIEVNFDWSSPLME